MYADDHRGTMPPNYIVQDQGQFFRSLPGSWLLGDVQKDTTTSNLERGLLFPYNRSVQIYHCPGDKSRVPGAPRVFHTRSYSLNIFLNTRVNGVFNGPRFKEFIGQLTDPAPVGVYTFVDTNPDCIDSGDFSLRLDPNLWQHLPTDRHRLGGNLAFADGHADYWHWRWPKKFKGFDQPPVNAADRADLARFIAAIPK
jgi:prepilin-type processing-associated H-X9-DG protein